MSYGPFRDGRVHVLAKKCTTCIFRPGNLMHLREGRFAAVVEGNLDADSALTCHQTLVDGPGEAPPAVCRGFYDLHRQDTAPLRLAAVLGVFEFDPAPEKPGDTGTDHQESEQSDSPKGRSGERPTPGGSSQLE